MNWLEEANTIFNPSAEDEVRNFLGIFNVFKC